jgi:hypothetical protein
MALGARRVPATVVGVMEHLLSFVGLSGESPCLVVVVGLPLDNDYVEGIVGYGSHCQTPPHVLQPPSWWVMKSKLS